MANFAFEEEKAPSKFNLGVWRKMLRYTFRNWPLLIVLALSMLLTTFYDSSFMPLMNAAAIAAIPEIPLGQSVAGMIINVELIFGIRF
ncbi:MAG TPA: hypothetical protein PLU89_04115, partial [Bacilli bacterium]|nr:hypothetical protein [Bacilli bacterium]